jgi:hypothetical protein
MKTRLESMEEEVPDTIQGCRLFIIYAEKQVKHMAFQAKKLTKLSVLCAAKIKAIEAQPKAEIK